MALKANDSFIRFVTMGAAGAHRAVEVLNRNGHDARELERYATCNKIWQRKIKRLRMPDLFCLRCGERFEVRAKSKLEIKMSDSPTVPGRQWDAGLRDEDVVLFVRCEVTDGEPRVAEGIEGFRIGELRASAGASVLGPAKSAGEGAERDRKWPGTVPSASGVVREVSADRLSVCLDTRRNQSFKLVSTTKGTVLTAYLAVGERFIGEEEFVAGAPRRKANLLCPGPDWDPGKQLGDPIAMTRFAAVKAAGLLRLERARPELWTIAKEDPEPRVRLEAIGALLRMEDPAARDALLAAFDQPATTDLRMEAVLLAGEVRTQAARESLAAMLSQPVTGQDEELRAAVLWSLGRFGHGDVASLIDYLGDASDLVASHAAVGLGSPLTPDVRDRLLELLGGLDPRAAASAAWVLQQDSEAVLPTLVRLAKTAGPTRGRAIAVLGGRTRAEVLPLLGDDAELQSLLEPWWAAAPANNWAAAPAGLNLLDDVRRQTLVQAI